MDALAQGSPQVQLNLSLGSSRSESTASQEYQTARGNALSAGGDIHIVARGETDATQSEASGNLSLQGTQVDGRNVTLEAVNDLILHSARNTTASLSRERSRGASIGVGVGLSAEGAGGVNLFASARSAQGNGAGASLTHNETRVTAADTLTLKSGRDTTLQGAQAHGERIEADIGRHLTLSSEQDRDSTTSERRSSGGGASVAVIGAGGGATFAHQRSDIDSDYLAVVEQSGLYAGTRGYDIDVGGHTQLTGAVIASQADPQDNRLSTDTLGHRDLENRAHYDAHGTGINLSSAGAVGSGLPISILPTLGAAIDEEAASLTLAAIAPGTLEVRRDAQTGLDSLAGLSRDSDDAHRALQPIFDKQDVEERLELLQVAGEELLKPAAAHAATWIGDTFAEHDAAKLAAHAGLGAALTTLLGTGWESGAAAGALGEALPAVLESAFDKDPHGRIKDPEAFAAATVLITTALAVGVGADLPQAVNAGVVADNAVRHNWLEHQEIIELAVAAPACRGGDTAACQRQNELEALNAQRDAAHERACEQPDSEACQAQQQAVRNAHAEILEARVDEIADVPPQVMLAYRREAWHTEQQADSTLALDERLKGNLIGALKAAEQQWDDTVTLLDTLAGALIGDDQDQQALKDQLTGLWHVITHPDELADSLDQTRREHFQEMADAYRRGDAEALGEMMAAEVVGFAGITRGNVGGIVGKGGKVVKSGGRGPEGAGERRSGTVEQTSVLVDDALIALRSRNPNGPLVIVPGTKNVLTGDHLPSRLHDANGSLIPLGFKSLDDYGAFTARINSGLVSAGFDDVIPVFQGSSVTGFKQFDTLNRRTGQVTNPAGTIFDTGKKPSDFDVGLASPQLFDKAQRLGMPLRGSGSRTVPLDDDYLDQLGLFDLRKVLEIQAGREVNFVVFDSINTAVDKTTSIIVNR